jgi:transcriptional regulator NrdR family protein
MKHGYDTRCPKCRKTEGSKVVSSRVGLRFGFPLVKRRRECLSCKRRWTTYEVENAVIEDLLRKAKHEKIFIENGGCTGVRYLRSRMVRDNGNSGAIDSRVLRSNGSVLLDNEKEVI